MNAAPAVQARGLGRRHRTADIVAGATFAIARGEAVALVGPSGCGKTTLLQMIGLLDQPTAGQVLLDGSDGWAAAPAARARLRLSSVGFVFQKSNLLPHLTALENVALPAWRLHGDRGAAMRAAAALLQGLGLASRAAAPARELSMGEAQRAAVARALINRPAIVIADEPTGSLDSVSAGAVLDALDGSRAGGSALLVATHDPAVAARIARTITMKDGRIVSA